MEMTVLVVRKNIFIDRFSGVYVRVMFSTHINMRIFRLICINYAVTNLSDTEATYDVEQLLTPTKSTGFSSNNFSFVEK